MKFSDTQNHGLSDIHHGNVYSALGLQLNEDHNICISFTLNTDGALVYQSTGCSMWPVLLMINELPFNARYVCTQLAKPNDELYSLFCCMYRKNPKNIILAALWFSAEKPPMQTFLEPVIKMLLPLETEGQCIY